MLPLVKSLPYSDKLRLMQFLISTLSNEEDAKLEVQDTAIVKPIGKVYYSGHSDNAKQARMLLFSEKRQAIQQRHNNK